MTFSSWYEATYPFLSGQGRWLRGEELNTIPPTHWDLRPYRILIARLSTSRDTLESFTHRLLYRIAADVEGVFPDCAYVPPPRDAELYRRDHVPWLLGTASKRGSADFDCIALTNAILQELLNLPAMLANSGIALRKSARISDPTVPLVILGGANAAATTMLWNADPLVDGIFIGGDTAAITRVFTLCRNGKKSGLTKSEILAELEAIPGFFQPEKIPLQHHGIDSPSFPDTDLGRAPIPFDADAAGSAHMQISEGCPCACSFCLESWMHKPYREAACAALVSQAASLKAALGLDRIELYSFNFNMHHDIASLLWELSDLFPSIGLKSQRFDLLARAPAMLGLLHAVGKTSLTCGMEGISARLRAYLNKSLSENDLRSGLNIILRSPMRELKVFLIATGLEAEADFEDFKQLLQFIGTCVAQNGRSPRIIFSCTPLVRLPCTPLEAEDAPGIELMERIMTTMAGITRSRGFEFRQACPAAEYWLSQIMARTRDAQVASIVTAYLQKTGFLYYRDIPHAFVAGLRQELQSAGIEPDDLLKGGSPDQTPAWGFIQSEEERGRLSRIRAHCTHGDDQPVDPAAPDQVRRYLGNETFAVTAEKLRERIKSNARAEQTIRLAVTLSEKTRGLPRKYPGIVLARAIMLADASLIKGYRGLRSTHWTSDWIIGDDLFSYGWHGEAIPRLTRFCADPECLARLNTLCEGWLAVRGPGDDANSSTTLCFTSPFSFDGDRYLASRNLRHTRCKTGEGVYRYDFAPDALKKKLLASLTVAHTQDGPCAVRLAQGPKFILDEFLTEAFRLPHPEEWARIVVKGQLG
jgi:radical SAM superfamily enzyme YgiQ (UPF0313 family)